MQVEFEKWHGCKNDFIVVWASSAQYKNIGPSLIRNSINLCERRSGIGADGILILVHAPNQSSPEQLVIINSDGSLAKNCGNGIRCAALSVYNKHLVNNKTPLESVELRVEGLNYICQFLPQKKGPPFVQVNMGVPILNENNAWHEEALKFVKTKLKDRNLEKNLKDIQTFFLANQHIVFFTEQELPLTLMRELSSTLQISPHWDGINVSFASPLETMDVSKIQGFETADPYKVFVWERGAGETSACGTAACAISAALLDSALIPRSSWIPLLFPGGWLYCKQEFSEEEIFLCGPGAFVFKGILDL